MRFHIKYFLVLLFGLLPFFASAQESDEVVIKRYTAEYFLELADKYAVVAQKNVEYEGRITNLVAENLAITQENESFEQDLKTFQQLYENEKADHQITKDEVKYWKKQYKKERFQKHLIVVGGVVLIVLVAI